MNSKLRFKQILQQYLKKEISKNELIEFLDSIEKNDHLSEIKTQFEKIWAEQFEDNEEYEEVDWDQMLLQIKQSDEQEVQTKSIGIWKKLKVAVGIAAAIVGIYIGGQFLFEKVFDDPVLAEELNGINKKEDTAIVENKKQTIHLPDGSTVTLNTNSTLNYPKEFTGNVREVVLSGEAFFDIKKNDHQSFKVITGDVTTTVLGTSFNIKAYKSESEIEVSVVTGKVNVSSKEKLLGTLVKNDQLIIDTEDQSIEQKVIDVKSVIAWKPESVKLENSTLLSVMKSFKENYGFDYVFLDSAAKNCQITFSYSTDDSMNELLMVVSKVLGLKYQIKDKTIYIEGSSCL